MTCWYFISFYGLIVNLPFVRGGHWVLRCDGYAMSFGSTGGGSAAGVGSPLWSGAAVVCVATQAVVEVSMT